MICELNCFKKLYAGNNDEKNFTHVKLLNPISSKIIIILLNVKRNGKFFLTLAGKSVTAENEQKQCFSGVFTSVLVCLLRDSNPRPTD